MSGPRRGSAFRGVPGERVLEEAAGVRQRCGGGSVRGTLYCTNLRVAFVPALGAQGSRAFLHSEYDVALPCIRKLVAASSFAKPKVLTAASSLKFVPEELAVHCRDFRVLRFHFHESGLQLQAFRVATAIHWDPPGTGIPPALGPPRHWEDLRCRCRPLAAVGSCRDKAPPLTAGDVATRRPSRAEAGARRAEPGAALTQHGCLAFTALRR
ncbi:myotubularin-related protein 11 [Struthio camelus]|uniref:myotubularin-related protein 11 n=1 Tax=Struthio camelus TaxID=8801 RepID=UPI0036041CF5